MGFKAFLVACVFEALALRVASAQAEAGSNALPDVPREIVLQPAVAPFQLEGLNVNLATPAKPFRQEPPTSSHRVFRSLLRFGQDTNNPTALIWDQPRQKLYLDLNHNLDLTDDPGGVHTSTNAGFQQTFTNVIVPLKTATGVRPVVVKVQCSTQKDGRWAWATLSSHSYWQANVTVAGQQWQAVVLEHLSDRQERGSAEFLLLRPWTAPIDRTSAYGGYSGLVPLPEHLFWLGQAFLLEPRFDASGPTPRYTLRLTPQRPSLTEINLSGEFIHYAVLRDTNGYTAILREPSGKVRLPQGTYAVSAVWLKKGPAEAFQLTWAPMVLKPATATNLSLGGPLTNFVVLQRAGRKLQMNYQLRGADGRPYWLVQRDPTRPPEFTVFHGGKKALTGKFQFG